MPQRQEEIALCQEAEEEWSRQTGKHAKGERAWWVKKPKRTGMVGNVMGMGRGAYGRLPGPDLNWKVGFESSSMRRQ